MDAHRCATVAPDTPNHPHPTMPLSVQRLGIGEVEGGCSIAQSVVAVALGQPEPRQTRQGTGGRRAAFARQIAMYLAHVGFGLPMAQVGKAFGRDRTTVLHACHAIEDRRDDERFDLLLDLLEQAATALQAASAINRQE